MKKVNKLFEYIFASKEDFSLENRLLINATLIGILTSLVGALFNLLLSDSLIAVLIPIGLPILLFALYFHVRFKKVIEPFSIFVITISLIGISVIWIFNGGINGSNTMPGFVILILSLIIVSERGKIYVICLFLALNITIYLIQLYRPDLITNFPSETERWIDSIFTLIYSSFFIYLIIRFLHNHYTYERLKVEESKKQLIQLNADKDRFISILAHDLKSPFNSILGFLNLLTTNIHKYDIDKIEKQITLINNSAQTTYILLEDLLLWARSQSGKLTFEPLDLNLMDLCREVERMLKPYIIAKKIKVIHVFKEDLIAHADSDMLKTILRNLISNALKFTRSDGQIEINASKTSSEITISVKDNGVGMPPEIASKLFDTAHTHTSSGTENESGTGLGLFLCAEFVEIHKGKIWVESKVREGSTFFFTIPINI